MGGKRVRLSNKFVLNKCQKEVCVAEEDRISQLPDEILVYILSFLTVKEAADTSVLSKRWPCLWRYIYRLDFDATKPLVEVASQFELKKSHMNKYPRWVNSTLLMFKGHRLDQFRICFDLNKSMQHEIDKWLEFAFSKKLQTLELDLFMAEGNIRYFDNCCAFPVRLLGLGDSADDSSCIPHSNISLVKQNFKSLKVLQFKSINVTGNVLDFFLHNCPFLEKMVVHGSGTLVNLEVVGPSLKLRHLEILYCFYVESLKICDTNLTTLKTTSGRALLLKNVPMLVEVEILFRPYTHFLRDISSTLSCVLFQLEVLTIDAFFSLEDLEHYNFPELTKLKKLILTCFTDPRKVKEQSLLGYTSIIRAAPQLKEFELHMRSGPFMAKSGPFKAMRECKKSSIKWPLHHLKVVKLWGYFNGPLHLDLVSYFLENAVALEKIIIDPTCPIFSRTPYSAEEIKCQENARNNAKLQLEGEVPPDIELVIL